MVAAALVIATIYVANPQNINRILNIAMNDQGGGGGGGSGGQTKSGRCPDGTFAPDGDLKYCKGGKKKVKAKKQTAAKKPKTAKSEKDCGKNELYFTDSYGNKKCYPLGFKIQAGYVVCKNSTYGWMDICKDSNNDGLNDVTKPPPAPEKSTSCTFTGYNNQNYTIGQGQSVISNTASPFACIGGQLIECTKVTQQELNKFPSLGDCKSPTIAPSNTSYSGGNPAKASCYSNGLLLSPNDLNFTSNGWQQCVNGQMAASP
ncbi:hypothetical protein COX59_01235, partial [Candidatus Beckwithbacteria bacterium CG_4_10_14_0_2_um_filter_47_25]